MDAVTAGVRAQAKALGRTSESRSLTNALEALRRRTKGDSSSIPKAKATPTRRGSPPDRAASR